MNQPSLCGDTPAYPLALLDDSPAEDFDAALYAIAGADDIVVSAPDHSALGGVVIGDVDGAQLLADTEELLRSLDPVVTLADTPETHKVEVAEACSSINNSYAAPKVKVKHEPSGNASKSSRVSKPGVQRNPSRERLQSELSHLRKQVLVLENQLQNVQERQVTSMDPTKMKAEVVVPMWERIAKRQRTASERAMNNNKRLKNLIRIQKELIVNMEESLYNWQHVASPQPALALGTSASATTPHKNVHLEPGDDLLFEMLVSELDATYLKVDEAFQEAGLDRINMESYTRVTPKTHVASDGALRSYFEIVEVEVSPFDFELSKRVADMCFEKQSQSPDCLTYHRDWGFEDIVTEKHRVKRVVNGAEIYFHMLLALKEYAFQDEVVCVWRGIFKCEDHFPATYVQEIGWFISTNMASPKWGNPASTSVGRVARSCIHLEPKRFTSSPVVIRADADAMTTLVMRNYQDDMQEVNDMMEKMLIQENSKLKANLPTHVASG